MSEQKNAKMFRTVFGGGYQKNDVNEYIESMQAQFASVEQILKNTINHQRAELDDLRRQNDDMMAAQEVMDVSASELELARAELETVRAELEAMKVSCITAEAGKATAEASLAAAREEIANLTAELDAAKQASAETAVTETAQTESVEPITETVLPADYEELKLKAEQYDRMSAHIGAIMLKANAGAEDVMKCAKAEADAMIAEVNRALQEKRVSAQSGADHLIGDISKSLSEISRGCREEIALDLEELRVALRTLESAVESKYTDINRKLDYAKEEMEQTADAIIRSATAPVTMPTES
jgi:chromosome segregation ATPase